MGDRANCLIVEDRRDDGTAIGVYLYTHWSGSEMPLIVQASMSTIAAHDRWRDPHYLAAIIAKGMQDSLSGIGAERDDNEHLILVIDTTTQMAAFVEEGRERLPLDEHQSYTFDDFANLDEANLMAAYQRVLVHDR